MKVAYSPKCVDGVLTQRETRTDCRNHTSLAALPNETIAQNLKKQ